jgi:hypothetical protein
MPGILAFANVFPTSTVLPQSLSTSFVEQSTFPILSTDYHDGTRERSIITDGASIPRPIRTWQLSKRLTPAQISTLLNFWEVTVFGGHKPFYFYDPFAVLPVGSSYDPTGNNSTGRVTVVFSGSWSQSVTIARTDIPSLTLLEVA